VSAPVHSIVALYSLSDSFLFLSRLSLVTRTPSSFLVTLMCMSNPLTCSSIEACGVYDASIRTVRKTSWPYRQDYISHDQSSVPDIFLPCGMEEKDHSSPHSASQSTALMDGRYTLQDRLRLRPPTFSQCLNLTPLTYRLRPIHIYRVMVSRSHTPRG
jgi:hypothetical protein